MLVPFMDAGIVVLLVGALVYMVLLNKRLNTITRNRAAIEKLLEAFSQSLLKAEESLVKLQENSSKFEKNIQENIRTGISLTDDLIFFIDRGEVIATDLEKEIRKARELKQYFASSQPPSHKEPPVFSASKNPPAEKEPMVRRLAADFR